MGEPTLPRVGWLAVVWEPNERALPALGDAIRCDALADQGPYSSGDPFAVLVRGDGSLDDPTELGGRVWAWETDLRTIRAAPQPCPLTMVALVRRRAGTTRDQFAHHWTERHGPLALAHHTGLADYRQEVVIAHTSGGAEGAEVDGIARLGFASRHDFETRFYDSEAGREVIRSDVARFLAPASGGSGRATTLVGRPRRGGGR